MAQGYAKQVSSAQLLALLGLNQTPTVQRFTSGSGTYTTPTGCTYIDVFVKGGGGGGGNGGGAGGGGGGEGGTAISRIISPAATYTYAIGAGGAAQTGGSNSTFSAGSMVGNGGLGSVTSAGIGGGSASGGNINNITGASSTNPSFVGSPYYGGTGGGTGGGAPTGSGAGANGIANSGGGGSGAGSAGGSGGSGGSGIIIVQEYYGPVVPVGATGSGNYVLATSPTITTPNLVGVTNASNATAGSVGELISSQILAASAVGLTTQVAANVTSISLTAGDWDVWGNVQFIGAASIVLVYGIAQINSTSATLGDQSLWGMLPGNTGGATSMGISAPYRRVNVSTTTTYYLVAQAQFTVAACSAAGGIYARRVR